MLFRSVDRDRDGLVNFAEYSMGCVPTYADSAPPPATAQIENVAGTDYLTYQYRLMSGATDASVTPEITSDLVTWLNGAANIVTVSGPTTSPNGSVTWKVRDINPFTTPGRRQFHLKMTGP